MLRIAEIVTYGFRPGVSRLPMAVHIVLGRPAMPERARRKKGWVRIAFVCAFLALAIALVAAVDHLPSLALLRSEVQSVRDRYFTGAQVEGAEAREVDPEQVSAARDIRYLDSEREWLLQSQMANGAIAQNPLQDLVVPYFANIAAKTMVDIDASRARAYISWYLENMNRPDRGGLSGTIYDFVMKDGELVPTHKYDSADSYAATFLSLVAYYYHRTGDTEFITSNLTAIDLAAQVILELQDDDGLIRVMPGSRTKYLMDNSECYRGLLDWAGVLRDLGEEHQSGIYVDVARQVADGIRSTLYDPERGVYAWSLTWYGRRFPKEGKWYPDAVSQADLIYCGVVPPSSPEAESIWARLNEQFPYWDQGVTGDRFPWAKIALTATMMNDSARAERFVSWVRDEYAESGRPYPWYVMESASTLDAVKVILTGRP